MEVFSITCLSQPCVMGIIFLIAGTIMYFFPPKSINNWYGYRTQQSQSSQAKWDFAQNYSTKWLIGGGLFAIICGFVLPYFGIISPKEETYSVVIIAILILVPTFWITEQKLKEIKD